MGVPVGNRHVAGSLNATSVSKLEAAATAGSFANDLTGARCFHPPRHRKQLSFACHRESAARGQAYGGASRWGHQPHIAFAGGRAHPPEGGGRVQLGRVLVNLVEWEKPPLLQGFKRGLSGGHLPSVSTLTSRVGICRILVTVLVPRPDWVLFATHQCNSKPNVELLHKAKAYSCSLFSKTTDGQARPPMHGRFVIATMRDWELNRKSRL